MKDPNFHERLGTTPPEFSRAVNEMIDQMEDRNTKKRYKITTLLAAALLVAALSAAAVAAVQGRLAEVFTNRDTHQVNEAAVAGIQELNETREGAAVRCTVQEALYDAEGETFALSWQLENLTGEDDLYVVLDGVYFGEAQSTLRYLEGASELFLPAEGMDAAVLGELPEGGGSECELRLTVLRAVGEYTQDPDGYIEIENLGAEDWEELYSDTLVKDGSFEIADRFALALTLDETKLAGTARRLAQPVDEVYDGFELRVPFGEITPTSAHIVVEYITDEEPVSLGKGGGYDWSVYFTLPGGDIWWAGNAGGTQQDAVRMDDGRWKSVYDFHAVELFTQPDELVLTLTHFTEGSVERRRENADATVRLKFE